MIYNPLDGRLDKKIPGMRNVSLPALGRATPECPNINKQHPQTIRANSYILCISRYIYFFALAGSFLNVLGFQFGVFCYCVILGRRGRVIVAFSSST